MKQKVYKNIYTVTLNKDEHCVEKNSHLHYND